MLVALYHATGGPSWKDNTNWLSDAPIGQWYGVTTDADGRVTELHLRRNQLSGEIPPEIANLTDLQRLFVQSNSISGPIPLQITNLTNLTRLDLGGNRFTGEIPAEMGNLLNIEHLELRDNQLTGNIPPELGHLVNLRILWLLRNRLSGEIPPEWSRLVALETLGLQNNWLTGTITSWLGDFPRLTRLELGGNLLTGDVPALFKHRTLAAVKLLPWVESGLNDAERGDYDHLLRSVDQYPQGVATALDKGWLVDGVSTAELSLIKYLGQMPPDVLTTVIAMPFMQSVDPADPNAVAALQQLERNDRGSFDRIMAHPTMADGIDDEEAKIVTFLCNVVLPIRGESGASKKACQAVAPVGIDDAACVCHARGMFAARGSGVGGKTSCGKVVQPHAVAEIANGALHIGTAVMVSLQFQGVTGSIGDAGVIAVAKEKGQLGTRSGFHPADDEAHRCGVRLVLDGSINCLGDVGGSHHPVG